MISDRKLIGFEDKTLLPEYDVFDDPRYFEPARERRLFELDEHKLASQFVKILERQDFLERTSLCK